MGALRFSRRFKLGSQLPTPGSWHEMDMCLRDSTVFPSDPHTGVFPWDLHWSCLAGPTLFLLALRGREGEIPLRGETILEVKK